MARSLTRMLGRGCSSDLTRSGKEATAERPSKTWKEDGLKAKSGWGRQICQGQGMKGGCGSGANRGPRDRARERPSSSCEGWQRAAVCWGALRAPPLTYPVLPELLHHSQAEDVRDLCVQGEAGGQDISVLERVSETAGSAVEAPAPLHDTAPRPTSRTYTWETPGQENPGQGTMEGQPLPTEARGCGPFS